MKKTLLSGIQPTGKMHLGNYLGAVQNWVALQHDYECFFMIVDLHALTTVYESPGQLAQDKLNLAIDLLASGVDPEKSTLYFQSDVPEHSELHLILSMITPLPWLTRVPTYKSKMEEIEGKDLNTYGFLGYPVLQAADILLFRSHIVPVGKDQLPHLELTREICRRFNHFFGDYFPEPQDRLTEVPALAGTDGRKMSKSYNNTIPLSLSPKDIEKSVMKMVTDPNRIKRDDPGNPDICSVFDYHKIFSAEDNVAAIDKACRKGEIGCVQCKRDCATALLKHLEPFQEKRAYFDAHHDEVREILAEGAKKARRVAQKTMEDVKQKIGLVR